MTPEDGSGVINLTDYLAVLRRRRWVFVMTALLVPLVAVVLSMRTAPTYQASVKVLLSQGNPADVVSGLQTAYTDPARTAQTQADLARVLEVIRPAVREAHVRGLTPAKLLKDSSVAVSPGSDFLTFSVTANDPRVASRLATTYARTFVEYRRARDVEQIARTRQSVERRRAQLEASGLSGTAAYRSVAQQIAALDALTIPELVVLHDAGAAVKVGPHVARNGMLALVLGTVLGLIVVFVSDAFDTRVRSVDTIRSGLNGLPLLARLPPPPRALRKHDRLVMVAAPTTEDAEPFRVLRAKLDYANGKPQTRTIMVTSGVGGEGKSTTAANLAVALARAGRRVVLIDFDLRGAHLHRLFAVSEAPGLTDVALRDVELDDALVDVPLIDLSAPSQNGQSPSRREGKLQVLPVGRSLDDPDQLRPELVVGRIVDALENRADVVLIDAAPLLPTGEAIALSASVDAILLVVRLNALPSQALDEVARILSASPAAKLGFVLTDADANPHKSSQHSGQGRAVAERG